MNDREVNIRYGGIGGKILGAFILASIILALSLCIVFYRSMKQDLQSQADLMGRLTVSYLARNSALYYAMHDREQLSKLIEGILEEAEEEAGAVFGCIKDQDSSFSVKAAVKDHLDLEIPKWTLDPGQDYMRKELSTPSGEVLIVHVARLHGLASRSGSSSSKSQDQGALWGFGEEEAAPEPEEVTEETDIQDQASSSGIAMVAFSQKPVRQRMQQNLAKWGWTAVLATLVCMVLGWLLSKRISTPIRESADIALKIADGKLDERAPVTSKDEIGLFSDAFNRMVDGVQEQITRSEEMSQNMQKAMERSNILVENVAQAVQQLSSSTSSILSVSAEQASGATEQAASVQEANTTSEEIATMARMISDNANSMENTSEQMTTRCEEGLRVVEDAMEAMGLIRSQVNALQENMMALNDNSQQVNEIVETINWFADQTNLVALNASIEAAGAGDAGVRFGAVANELRELARNINEQTKQIRERANQIQTSIASTVVATENGTQTVEHGTEVVQRVRESFQQIMDLVTKTGDAIKHIHVSTKQQEGACSELASNISGVATVATQVAQNAEQTERSLGKLDQLAAQLRELLGEDQE